MKIYRDSKEYELTFSEMIQAHEEYEIDCAMDDVRSLLGPESPCLSDRQVRDIAGQAIHNLGKNDSYFDAYWMTVQYTLDDYINNLPVEEEEE